jgi:tetratricopeptide (TPR) repeat protein
MTETRPSIFSLTVGKAIVSIVLLGWLAYANSMTKAFLLDDHHWIDQNEYLPSWDKNLRSHPHRPVVALSLTANWKIGGLHRAGYHFVNGLIHIGAALALFGIVRRTLLLPRWRHEWDDAALPLAFAAAAIWVVHPLNTHAVTYIIQRCESGMGLGYALALYCMIRGDQSRYPGWWNVGSVLAAWLGVGCKEVMMTIVPVALLYDRIFLADSWAEIVRRRGLLYVGLASTVALPLSVHLRPLLAPPTAGGASAGFHLPGLDSRSYFLTELGVIPYYLRLAFWPIGLCFDYRDWPVASSIADNWPAGLILTSVFAVCVYGAWRRNGFAFLGLSVFLILSVSSSFLPLLDVANEYRMYVPLMPIVAGFVIAGFLVVRRLWPESAGRTLATSAALGAIVVALLTLTFLRNEVYRSPLAIWEDVLAKRPTNYKAYEDIAAAHEHEGNGELAKQNRELCLKHQSGNLFASINLAMSQCRDGHFEEGLELLARASKYDAVDPDGTAVRLATFVHLSGDSAKALALLDDAKAMAPDKPKPRFHRAGVLLDMGRRDEARDELAEAVRLFPDEPEKFLKISRAFLRGRHGDAVPVRREALFYASLAAASAPDKNVEALMTLADVLAWNGRYAEALAPLREAIGLTAERSASQARNLKEQLRSFEWKAK